MYRASILAVNMRRHNDAMHTLLATNTEDDILCVQEPWFNRIGVAREDTEREGRDVLGGAAHPDWSLFYPFFTGQQRAKVMIYVRKFTRAHGCKHNPIKVAPRLDLVQHNTILITDIHTGQECLRVINFYNDVDDASSFRALTSLNLDPTIPTILVGDFNTHSHTWSPTGWTPSPRAHTLEEWAAGQTLELQTTRGDITRRGGQGECSSTLDLTWHNFAASLTIDITPPTLDWAASLGSDHARIRTIWILNGTVRPERLQNLSTYKTDLDDDQKKAWREALQEALPPLPLHFRSTSMLDDFATQTQAAYTKACEERMEHKRPMGAHAHKWWNKECAQGGSGGQLRGACGGKTHAQAHHTTSKERLGGQTYHLR